MRSPRGRNNCAARARRAVVLAESTLVEGADVGKPVDDVHASSLVVLDKGTQQQSLVELGREYAVTCRKERRAAPAPR